MFEFFIIPYTKPDASHTQTAKAQEIAYVAKAKHLLRHKDVGRANGSHEESRNQRYPERFVSTSQINGQSPKREYRQA